ncbi:hypothetical protein K523DRAFT_422476, partial [Schizophyllum commune Tattone D]
MARVWRGASWTGPATERTDESQAPGFRLSSCTHTRRPYFSLHHRAQAQQVVSAIHHAQPVCLAVINIRLPAIDVLADAKDKPEPSVP